MSAAYQKLGLAVGLISGLLASGPSATLAADRAARWTGTIECHRDGRTFQAARTLMVEGRTARWKRGDAGGDGFETISGTIGADGEVMLHGSYHWQTEKPFWLLGRFENDHFAAAGARGPKWCDLLLKPIREERGN